MNEVAPSSKKVIWTSYVLTGFVALTMIASGIMKVMEPPSVIEGFAHFGFNANQVLPLGLVELACTVLYLIPRTSVLGAILLTGYLGGAVATVVRMGDGFVFQVVLGVMLWGGLFLRDQRLRALIPLRKPPERPSV